MHLRHRIRFYRKLFSRRQEPGFGQFVLECPDQVHGIAETCRLRDEAEWHIRLQKKTLGHLGPFLQLPLIGRGSCRRLESPAEMPLRLAKQRGELTKFDRLRKPAMHVILNPSNLPGGKPCGLSLA